MRKQRFLYKKISLPNIEIKSSKLNLSDDKKIYYIENKKRIEIYDLTRDPIDKNISGIDINIEMKDNNIVIYLNVDSVRFEKMIADPIKMTQRKDMINMFKNCVEESKKEYLKSIQLSVVYSAYQKNNPLNYDFNNLFFRFHKGNIEWMKKKEEESKKTQYILSGNYIKIGSYFIDTSTGKIQESIDKIPTRLRGGILVNSIDSYWMYDFLNLNNVSTEGKIKENYLNTKATLILVDTTKIAEWIDKIHNINKLGSSKKIFYVIDSSESHEKVTYDSILKSDYILISVQYLLSDNYKRVLNSYLISENMNFVIASESMRADYVRCKKKILNYTCPIISLVYWTRTVIDDYTLNMMHNDNSILDRIFCIESYYKWIQLNSTPEDVNKLIMCVNFLIKYNNANLPVYDDDHNLVFLGDLIRFNIESCSFNAKDINIDEEKVKICMTDYEKYIYNYLIENSKSSTKKDFLLSTVSDMSVNSVVSDFIKEPCSICYQNLNKDNCVVTECKHQLCLDCCLNSIKFTNTCFYCRNKLHCYDYHKIVDDDCSKIKKIKEIINTTDNNTVVVCSTDIVANKLSSLDLNVINNRNIQKLKDMRDIDQIVFFEPPDSDIRDIYLDPKIYRDRGCIKYLYYGSTIEEQKLKNISNN